MKRCPRCVVSKPLEAFCRNQKPAKHLDHDHATGKIRGVLCFSCNRGLGKFGDNPVVVRRAAAYVTGAQ